MSGDAGVEPGGSIAEAFANVLFPTPASSGKRVLAYAGRFTDFSARSQAQLCFEQLRVTFAQRVGKAGPNEMKEFVNQNEPQEDWVGQQFLFEDHSSLANETSGMHGGSKMRMRRQQFAPVFR
ncbi:MAG: hypothetical protein JWP08_287 [Bryobacterales bacterium]|nr:hypothetical protein [Bryobacterales bacterium]